MTDTAPINDVAQFITGGKAVLTVANTTNNKHVTLRFARGKDPEGPIFVSTLTGSDNTDRHSYTYIGCLWTGGARLSFTYGKKSKLAQEDPSVKTAAWLTRIARGEINCHPTMEIHHEGRCCFCARPLTQTESVTHGYGPHCADKHSLPYGPQTKRARKVRTSTTQEVTA